MTTYIPEPKVTYVAPILNSNKAVKCPVCNGDGRIRYFPIIPMGFGTDGEIPLKTCHGCNGKGWVVI